MDFLCWTCIQISTQKGLNLFLAMGKRQDQYTVEDDISALTLENAMLALQRKAFTKTLKSYSGVLKGKGRGRWYMQWTSAGSQYVSMCFSPMTRTKFSLGTALPCPFFLMDYGMSAA